MIPVNRRSGIKGATAIAAALLLYLGFISWSHHRARVNLVWLSPEVYVDVVAVLTADAPHYVDWPLKNRLFSYLPRSVQRKSYKWLDLKGGLHYDASSSSPHIQPGQIQPLLELKYPAKWNDPNDFKVAYARLLQLRGDTDHSLFARLNYGNGFYSKEYAANFSALGSGDSAKFFVTGLSFNVPADKDTIMLEFYRPAKREAGGVQPEKIVTSIEIRNPLPKPDALTSPNGSSSPHGTSGNIEVVLHHLLSRTDGSLAGHPLPHEREAAVKAGKFNRLPETMAPLYRTVAVFEVLEDAEATSNWRVANVDVRYGKGLVPFPVYGGDVGQVGKYHVVTLREDVGALEQAVELGLQLVRQNNFSEDEVQRLELPVPRLGYSTTGYPMDFWSGTGNVWVANKEFWIDWFKTSPSHMTLAVDRLARGGVIEPASINLVFENGTIVDLLPYKVRRTDGDRGFGYIYDTDRALIDAGIKAGSLDEGSTVAVELISPRTIDHIKIIAEPKSAVEVH